MIVQLLLVHQESGHSIANELGPVLFQIFNHTIHFLIDIALHFFYNLSPQLVFGDISVHTLVLLFFHDYLYG